MKIILCAVNAKFIHTNIAVRMIKQYCEKHTQCDISVCEYTINNYAEDIVQDLYTRNPDVLAFSCYIWNIELIRKISTMIRLINPDIKIIFGGPEVSYNPSQVLERNPQCDIIVSGEGEKTSALLYKRINDNTDFKEINGISFRNENGEVVVNPPASPMNMDNLPFPYEDLSETDNKICYYEASRGCPFRCQYCLSSIENGVRFKSIGIVKKELLIFINHKVRQVKFVDRTFNAKNDFAVQIIKFILENDNGITNFHFEVAAEIIKDEFLDLLKTARKGLFQLEIGVQSTNEATLKEISRNGAFDKIRFVTDTLKESENIHIHLDLIAGLPYENLDSFKKSFDDVHSLYPHQLQLGFLKVLHGSGMEKLCRKHDIEYFPYPPYEVFQTNCLTFSEILELKHIEEMVEIYYNSGRFVHSIRYLINHSSSFYDTYKKLALRRSSVFTENISHNKNNTYSYLIDAVSDFENADTDLFKWILKFDYIIHEKPRGTPAWTEPILNILTKDEIYEMTIRKKIFESHFKSLYNLSGSELLKNTHIEKMPFNPLTYERKDVLIIVNYTERDSFGNALYKMIF